MGSEIPVAEGGEDEEMVKMRTSQMGRLNLITAASGWDIKLRELVMREAKEGDLLSPSTPTSPSTTSQSSTSPTSANQNPTSAAAALHARRLSSRRSTPLLSIPSQHTTLSLNARSSILLSPQPLDLPTPSYFDPAAAAHHNRPRSQTLYRRASQFNTIVRGYDERLREIVMEAAKPALEDGVRARTLGMRRSGLWTRRGTPFTSTSTSDNNFDLSDVQRARDWVQTQSFTHDSASDSDSDSDASSSASTSSSSDSEDDNDPPTARTPRRQSIPHLLPTTDTTRPTLVVKDEPAPSLSSHSELSRNPSGKSNHRIRRVSAVQVVVPPNLKGGVDVSGKEVAGGGVKSAKGKSGTKKTSGEREKAVGKGDATDATSSRTVPILKQPAPRRTPATATTPGTKKILKPSDSKPTKSSTTPSSPPITTPTSSPTPPEPDSTPTLNPKSPDKDKPPPSSSSSSRPSSSPVKKSLKKSTPTTSPTFSPKSPKSPASPPHKSTRTPKTIRTKPTSSSSASTSTPANPKSRNVRFEDHRSSPPGSPPGVKNAKASGAGVVEHAKRVSDVSDGGGKDSAVEC
ncbi:hypothetical protein HK097_002713 [Rhizophlyctis rosea]|uniref:Uncharacterized protein n=1 Tax=Rhizophlyctis rosea TaxID=64517 RepID=A0AAD5X943_9FUNG|nr:hypothetical protein HK097_002713 [Rhizophlyctis rosea]